MINSHRETPNLAITHPRCTLVRELTKEGYTTAKLRCGTCKVLSTVVFLGISSRWIGLGKLHNVQASRKGISLSRGIKSRFLFLIDHENERYYVPGTKNSIYSHAAPTGCSHRQSLLIATTGFSNPFSSKSRRGSVANA